MARPCRPSWLPICSQTAASYPSVVSMSRRTSADGDLSSRKARTVRLSSSCSSLKAKFTCALLVSRHCRLAGQPEHPLTDDVLLDLRRARVDGLGPAQQEGGLE